jgi:imidazolonepropionase-like amidohydrolase
MSRRSTFNTAALGALAVFTTLTPLAPAASPAFSAGEGQDPAAEAAEQYLIHAGRVIVRPGEVLENVKVLVRDGSIVAVGDTVEAPEGVVEIRGAVVCAGFIDPWSALGVDAGSLHDQRTEPATLTADAIDVHAQRHLRQEALRAGVVAARVQAGGAARVGGVGALVRLDPELSATDALVLPDAVLAMSVGLSRGGGAMDVFDRQGEVDRVQGALDSGLAYRRNEVEYRYKLEEWQEAMAEKEAELEKDFKKAKKDRAKDLAKAEEDDKELKEKKYKEDKKPRKPSFDGNKAALARAAHGEIPLVVQVHRAAELRSLLGSTEGFDRLRLILAGATEAEAVKETLAERGVPVLVAPSLAGAGARDEWDGADLGLAGRLSEAGVEVLLGSGGEDPKLTRDLPMLAASAVGHGLELDTALAALTIGAARHLDVADQLGTVEVGKSADILILDGAPLLGTTSVQYVLSAGRLVVTPEN